jgi:hypothetical protein
MSIKQVCRGTDLFRVRNFTLIVLLALVVAGCDHGRRSGRMSAATLERFVADHHVTPTEARCRAGDDGYDYVCTYAARGRQWKQGFLVSGERVTSWTSPALEHDRLVGGPRPEPEQRARLVHALGLICGRGRFTRAEEEQVVLLEPAVPAAQVVEFTAFAGAFTQVVDSPTPEARKRLSEQARRLGVDC